jgi:hypothetical protein
MVGVPADAPRTKAGGADGALVERFVESLLPK